MFRTGKGVMHPQPDRLRLRAAPPPKGSAPRDISSVLPPQDAGFLPAGKGTRSSLRPLRRKSGKFSALFCSRVMKGVIDYKKNFYRLKSSSQTFRNFDGYAAALQSARSAYPRRTGRSPSSWPNSPRRPWASWIPWVAGRVSHTDMAAVAVASSFWIPRHTVRAWSAHGHHTSGGAVHRRRTEGGSGTFSASGGMAGPWPCPLCRCSFFMAYPDTLPK